MQKLHLYVSQQHHIAVLRDLLDVCLHRAIDPSDGVLMLSSAEMCEDCQEALQTIGLSRGFAEVVSTLRSKRRFGESSGLVWHVIEDVSSVVCSLLAGRVPGVASRDVMSARTNTRQVRGAVVAPGTVDYEYDWLFKNQPGWGQK